MKHNSTLTIRLTYAQKRVLQDIAILRETSVSEVVRAAIMTEVATADDLRRDLRENGQRKNEVPQ
jgi:uncharacterized protein (DUF1778 family)